MLQEIHSNSTSQTSVVMDHLAMHGATPPMDEVDHRPLPDDDQIELAMLGLFGSAQELLSGSQLEDDLEEVLWSLTNIFHRRISALTKRIDDTDITLREMLTAQDGSEVKSVELERIQDRSAKLYEQISSYENIRDMASEQFASATGSSWLPRAGSKISNRALTASVINSKSYMMAKRRKENETLCPEGTRIAFSGGDFQDHNAIWKALDASFAKYPDMILLHGGNKEGAEFIAAKWADARNVTQVVFQPEWKAHGKAAPFKRNDKLLETIPQGLIVTPGTGITENLADKARKLGIKILRLA